MPSSDLLTLALAQIAPVFLDRQATLEKILAAVDEAAGQGAQLVCFGEALLPGYPVWLERTDGARFESPDQKEFHALYLSQSVSMEDLAPLQDRARARNLAVVLGVLERAADRGGHSLYCSRVFVSSDGQLGSVHRKLMPTYEERLSWSIGDGAGLRVEKVGAFQVGSLLCWENWMPLARAALQADGENLHLALWPGGRHNTEPTTRFLARESRSYCASVSGLLRAEDIPADFPQRERLLSSSGRALLNGGSCLAGPDGDWLLEPIVDREVVQLAQLDLHEVRRERQNFDPAGHYSRPDVLRLEVDRRRQRSAHFRDS